MRLPRDVSGADLAHALRAFGYRVTIPNHDPLRVGTLAGILADVADHLGVTHEGVAEQLFGTRR